MSGLLATKSNKELEKRIKDNTRYYEQVNNKENWEPRKDGSKKGMGYLGALERPDGGISTELSIGVNINNKEIDIPLLVPTLSKDEINYLLKTDDSGEIPASIINKAIDHAIMRIKAGKSPFSE